MRYGVCAGPDRLETVKKAGAEYIECSVTGLCALSDVQFEDFCRSLDGIRCEALNVLFPAAISLIGQSRDTDALHSYLGQAFARVAPLKPEVIVFGSGAARRRPDGVGVDQAFEQLTRAGRIIAEEAERYGITIALEPLNRGETNTVNTLRDGAELVRAVDRPNFRLLADIYHMLTEGEPAEEIIACKGLLVHTHIAMREGRTCPHLSDGSTLLPYFEALRGYTGRMSVEGNFTDMAEELPEAFSLFRRIGGAQ